MGVQRLLRDLNHLYSQTPALHQLDFSSEGFAWVDCHDAGQSVISYLRYSYDGTFVLVILNFTPIIRSDYRIGVPASGSYHEIINSDSSYYEGSNAGNMGRIATTGKPWMGLPDSIVITLPPLAGLVFALET